MAKNKSAENEHDFLLNEMQERFCLEYVSDPKSNASAAAIRAGYAEKHISQQLRRLGAVLDSSQGFLVDGREGPLTSGELLRAEEWGKKLA